MKACREKRGRVHSENATRPAAHEAERLSRIGAPFRHAGRIGNLLEGGGIGRLLHQHQVRRAGVDHRGDGLAAAAAAMQDVVGQEPEHQSGAWPPKRPRGFSKSVRYGLVQQIAAKLDHDLPRRLDVDRPLHHVHQLLSQRHQVGRDVGIVVAQRPRVDAGDEVAARLEERQRAVAHQREIEIARAGALGVERRVVLPALAGDGAAPQDDRGSRRHHFFDRAAELVEKRLLSVERQANHVLALLLLGQPSLDGLGRLTHGRHHFKDRAVGLLRSL